MVFKQHLKHLNHTTREIENYRAGELDTVEGENETTRDPMKELVNVMPGDLENKTLVQDPGLVNS